MTYIDPTHLDLEDRVVSINRVTKVVKGGRRLRFAAIVIVGDKDGHVGFGTGKAQEVPEAIRKAVEDAKKNLINVLRLVQPYLMKLSVAWRGRVLLKPAVEGSGIAAGGAVRAVMELAGIDDVTSKTLGSKTAINVIRATIDGLTRMKTAEQNAELRNISVESLQN